MKKIALILSLMMLLTTIFTLSTSAATLPLRVVVNGKKIMFPDAQPFIDSKSRTQVPSRFIAEALGAKTKWDGNKQQATFEKDSIKLVLTIGKSTYQVNGVTKKMDTAALIKDSRTYVPARYVAEAFGAKVRWDGQINTVYISSDGSFPEPEPEIGTTLDYGGILFNDVTDVDKYGRMSVEKSKEFLMRLAKSIQFMKENGKYLLKVDYPELPKGFKYELVVTFHIDGVGPRGLNTYFDLPNTGSFVKETMVTSENINQVSVIRIVMRINTAHYIEEVSTANTGQMVVVKSGDKTWATFVPVNAIDGRVEYPDFNFKKTFQW